MLLLQVLPIEPKYENHLDTIVLVSIFICVVSCTAYLWYQKIRSIRVKGCVQKPMTEAKMLFMIRWSVISTLLGNMFVYIDRVYIRGIDYSQGFRNARYQWNNSSIPGSILSKCGNLMIPFSYCALFLGLYHWEYLNKKNRIISIGAGFGGQFVIAMLNGGRSNILLSICFALVVCVLRKYNGKSFLPRFNGRLLMIISASIVILYYVASILFWIADNDIDYLQKVADMLGAKVKAGYVSNPIVNMLTEIVLYILHGIYFIPAVVENYQLPADMNHNISFRWIFVMLARTPLLSDYTMELPEFDVGGGNFIALPGILIYDYGYVGFIIACIFWGVLLGSAIKILNTNPNNYGMGGLVLVIFILLHVYMSVMTMALNFGYFMFMIFAMVCMELIARAKYGKSSWLNVIVEP
ncbi:hypothetical protein SAMN02910301_0427 [Lachnospiraceae bacterium XBD2001]|nr:hypothetical protein SAMN02910301_0427 [Lachnospiraceae bacterium XBD2001]